MTQSAFFRFLPTDWTPCLSIYIWNDTNLYIVLVTLISISNCWVPTLIICHTLTISNLWPPSTGLSKNFSSSWNCPWAVHNFYISCFVSSILQSYVYVRSFGIFCLYILCASLLIIFSCVSPADLNFSADLNTCHCLRLVSMSSFSGKPPFCLVPR